MRVLLVNDDGIHSEGIRILAKELEKDYEVIVVAPEEQKSAQSQAITISKSLIVKEIELDGLKSKAYSVSGTPADCVRVALDKLIEKPVDFVISGINTGLNAGMDVLYSGTVSAAIEANIYKLPSMAISAEWLDGKIDYHLAAKYGRYILEKARDNFIKNNIVLSINIPYLENDQVKGIKVCKIGDIIYDYYIVESNGENGEKVLKLHGRQDVEFEEDTDRYYLSQGYVTITPLHYDLTNFNLIDKVRSWL
ncbi:5'/3'-nucleotidase SurE [Tepidimicrobium xylanilyticum]|uniref:5'-nucleotidase SurE n=1 Tax=Tepidimicrobium xylanilyticum TaxID=1123352 RepID=A0A1H3ALK4_9FIRM|nr:5'/3'-nucleotidase SurE [Tepidimicrobium xylanilyticum]GMG98097.1 5'-nucleotidase SurE [Tepidimicrobium xylanilyticum]SDX30503.1 5'-nucleotidase /3'-nucleotidase /exopolyphosphatase [Tepidimicrobium xylanilyticum]